MLFMVIDLLVLRTKTPFSLFCSLLALLPIPHALFIPPSKPLFLQFPSYKVRSFRDSNQNLYIKLQYD